MGFKPVILATDLVIWAMFLAVVFYALAVRRHAQRRATWVKVFREPVAMAAFVVLCAMGTLTVLDSLHFRRALASAEGQAAAFSPRTESVLDLFLAKPLAMREKSYSSPLAVRGFSKETVEIDGKPSLAFPRLDFAGSHLKSEADHSGDLTLRGLLGLLLGAALALGGWLCIAYSQRNAHGGVAAALAAVRRDETTLPWRAAAVTWSALAVFAGLCVSWGSAYHVLGTDFTGNDVLVQTIKSLRTAFVIGTLATLATLPFAVVLGITAGYFKGWVDDAIQYFYTTVSSIPSVLLIAACVLMAQVFIDQNSGLFETGAQRSDFKLFLLCMILGLTSWAGLCRLVRAETLKVSELDYVQAATGFGLSHVTIMLKHILPNVMHLVLISAVLQFSGLVLYEAVLTYIGVGVDPTTNSFGGMINQARTEVSRDPVVWWGVSAAFAGMVGLVLAANLFADGVQQAFDPRARSFKLRGKAAAASATAKA